MSVISRLLLTRFWPNFKNRFLGQSWTDSNCHGDICPGNICPGYICLYQQYLSCYLLDLAFFLGSKIFFQHFFDPKFFLIQNFFGPKFFWAKKYLWSAHFRPEIFFRPKNFFNPTIFFELILKKIADPKFFKTKILTQTFSQGGIFFLASCEPR